MQRFSSTHSRRTHRDGFLTPLIAMALLVVMGIVALVLDRLWLDAAQIELQRTAESAALGAAGRLVDESLYTETDAPDELLNSARHAAIQIAAANLVAGSPVELDPERRDIRFGRRVRNAETDEIKFLETIYQPSTVVVTAHQTRYRKNPVALFLRDLTGVGSGDVVCRASASLRSRAVGLRAANGIPIPMLPVAIRITGEPRSLPVLDWPGSIELADDGDSWSFDAVRGKVQPQADGIPEWRVRSAAFRQSPEEADLAMLDLATDDSFARYVDQIRGGVREEHLPDSGGELLFLDGPFWLKGGLTLSNDLCSAFREQLGEPRIVALFDESETSGAFAQGRMRCIGFAALRLVDVVHLPGNAVELVFQPCLLTSRAVVLASELDDERLAQWEWPAQPSIFKLQLTN